MPAFPLPVVVTAELTVLPDSANAAVESVQHANLHFEQRGFAIVGHTAILSILLSLSPKWISMEWAS